MIIIIPTKDRPQELENTIKYLNLNKFFFKKIIIVDASTLKKKIIIKKIIKKYDLNIQIINSRPSTCIQRNIGFNFVKSEKYIMFLDDDNFFYPDSFYRMKEFLNSRNDFVGVAFNQICKSEKSFLEKLKKINFWITSEYIVQKMVALQDLDGNLSLLILIKACTWNGFQPEL